MATTLFISCLKWLKLLPSSKKMWINIFWITFWTLVAVSITVAMATFGMRNACPTGKSHTTSLKDILTLMLTLTGSMYSLLMFSAIGYAGVKVDMSSVDCFPHKPVLFLISCIIYNGINVFNAIFYIHSCDQGNVESTLYHVLWSFYLLFMLIMNIIPVGIIGSCAAYFTRWKNEFEKPLQQMQVNELK